MLRQFAAVVLLTASPGWLPATEPSPLASPTSDVMLGLKVAAALQAHAALKDLPLTIDVVRGVAAIGGEVPDDDSIAAIRAVAVKVPGLTDAKVTCWVPGGNDPFFDRVREKLDGKPSPKVEPRAVLAPVVDRRVETHVTAHRPANTLGDSGAAAEALRAGDSRFARLTLAFDAGVVVVSGHAASHADAMALLLHLRKVPGVTRVRRGSITAAD
jgi:osmotically-inducible protein OsmY